MTTTQHIDYIIIGQGLAGSAVAIQLLKRNKRILVVDQPSKNTSSRIAAGLFNPITGKKMVKTWLADKLFPCLYTHYLQVEALSGKKFFHPMPLYRPFLSIEEQNEWMARSAEADFAPYIENIFTQSQFSYMNDHFGGLLLKQSGYVDTTSYINAVRSLIQRNAVFLMEDAAESNISLGQSGIRYKNYEADRIIFCNGVHATGSFDWLPVRPLKGETIRIETSQTDELIINRGVYIVPSGTRGEWRVGATYNFHDDSPGVTGQSRVELVEKMKQLVNFPFNIVEQEWGMRPTTPDRRPLLGRHPELKAVFSFNGLGTKGVSLAPYFSEVLIDSIENEQPLNKVVDIERYKSLYWSSPK